MKINKKHLIIISVCGLLLLTVVYFLFIRNTSTTNWQNEKSTFVDRGIVYDAVEAVGVVEPENEVIVLCPHSSILIKIIKEPGSRVKKGEIIMELDQQEVCDAIDKLEDQLKVKRNSLQRTKLQARMTKIDLDYNVEVKKLKIASIKSQLADEEQLLSVGGISSAKLDETKQKLILAEKDLDMVLKKNDIRIKQMKTEETGLNLQIEMQEKLMAEKIEMLEGMQIKAPSDGIILSISGKVGQKIGADKPLMVLSDLTTFKIKGSLEEKYSEIIKTGNKVSVLVEDEKIGGRIGNVTPTVSNNKIQFNVHFTDSIYHELIPNQTVKLMVLKSLRNNVLRIPSFGKIKAHSKQVVNVIDSGKTYTRTVTFGLKGEEYQEVVSGLNEGEEIVFSK